jgi:hypothetical protein
LLLSASRCIPPRAALSQPLIPPRIEI